MSLATLSVDRFLDNLGSDQAVPGGGSVAALVGALGASLLAMVCRLTLGKKGYEGVGPEMESALANALRLQKEFRDLMESDVQAYTRVMEAYKLPKETEEHKTERTRAVQQALKTASTVPLKVAETCLELLKLSLTVAKLGNKNAASDAGVGAFMAEAALQGAVLNVTINLSGIQDPEFVSQYRSLSAGLVGRATDLKPMVMAAVQSRM